MERYLSAGIPTRAMRYGPEILIGEDEMLWLRDIVVVERYWEQMFSWRLLLRLGREESVLWWSLVSGSWGKVEPEKVGQMEE